jgi:drug/metabolite transporter (DMT)-like permease
MVGLIGYYLSPVCYLMGMERSSASNASIIIASAPVWTVLFSWLLGLDQLSGTGGVALGLSIIGCLLVGIVPRTALPTTEMLIGNGLLLLDAALWGVFIVLNKQLMAELPPLEATVWSMVVAMPALWVTAGLTSPASYTQFSNIALLVSLAFSGLLSMGLGQYWWNLGLNDLGPAQAGIYANAIPLIALISSVIFLGEPLTVVKVIGVSLILGGVYLLRRDSKLTQTPILGKTLVS